MAANTSQIFSRVADIQWTTTGTTANTAKDGTGTVGTVFTADATNGGRVERVVITYLGTNVASMVRFFVNNGSTTATATNNSLIEEVAMPALTISEAGVNTPQVMVRVPIVLPPGYRLTVALATACASGFAVTAFGGKY